MLTKCDLMYGIYHNLNIACSAKELFTTISTPKGLDIWWTKSSNGEAILGNSFNFYFAPEYDWRGEVIKLGKQSISYKMTKADEDWIHTEINFEIQQVDSHQQLLRFEHILWRDKNDHFRHTSFCWANYLMTMKQHLER